MLADFQEAAYMQLLFLFYESESSAARQRRSFGIKTIRKERKVSQMYYLYVLAGEKIKIEMESFNDILLNNLTVAHVPWYVCNNTNKVVKKQNCDLTSITNAKSKILKVRRHKTYYELLLTWWAGHRVIAAYKTKQEALKHLSVRSSTYRGNGIITCEERKAEEYVELSEEVLKQIINSFDETHCNLCFKWE